MKTLTIWCLLLAVASCGEESDSTDFLGLERGSGDAAGVEPVSFRAESAGIGGFLETTADTEVRPLYSSNEIGEFMPERGSFVFPEPYGTQGARITNESDCGGQDCVAYAGYAYWRNINNHAGSDTMLMFVGLDASRGGDGLTLFGYDKEQGEVHKLGSLFPEGNHHNQKSGEGMYFSAAEPHAVYLTHSGQLLRYDVVAQTFEPVFDARDAFSGAHVWQAHSSDDDKVHSATLKDSQYRDMGCVVYNEDTGELTLYERRGAYDECQVDGSGEWLVIKENVSAIHGEDNRIIHLPTGEEVVLYDEDGAAGHSDNGHGYMVAEDNWAGNPGSTKVWYFDDLREHVEVYRSLSWDVDLGHISHTNALAGRPAAEQYACSSRAGRNMDARSNEIICYLLNGEQEVLVVAPVMTDMAASGGRDHYGKQPKANLDPTGEYIFWTTNLGGDRLDAVVARVPTNLLYRSPPNT